MPRWHVRRSAPRAHQLHVPRVPPGHLLPPWRRPVLQLRCWQLWELLPRQRLRAMPWWHSQRCHWRHIPPHLRCLQRWDLGCPPGLPCLHAMRQWHLLFCAGRALPRQLRALRPRHSQQCHGGLLRGSVRALPARVVGSCWLPRLLCLRPRALQQERGALCGRVHAVRERALWECQRCHHVRAVPGRALCCGLWGREQCRVPAMPQWAKERAGLCSVRLCLHCGRI